MKARSTKKRRAFQPLVARDYRERDVVGELRGELRDAWRALRAFARTLGGQRIYASNKSVMFARRHCYAFVRPRKTFLEVCFFSDRAIRGPGLKVSRRSSRKLAHSLRLERAEQIDAHLTGWLREAFLLAGAE